MMTAVAISIFARNLEGSSITATLEELQARWPPIRSGSRTAPTW